MLRELHEAVRDFHPPSDARWRGARGAPKPGQIIIHGDVAPWNLLEDAAGHLTGVVDFDTARPGRALEDVAYTAWHVTPLHDELMGDGTPGPLIVDRPGRLRVLADAYGLDPGERSQLLSEVARMQVSQAFHLAARAHAGDAAMRRLWHDGRFTVTTARSLLWLHQHRQALTEALQPLR